MQAVKEIGSTLSKLKGRLTGGSGGPNYLKYISPYTLQLKWQDDPHKEHLIPIYWLSIIFGTVFGAIQYNKWKKGKNPKPVAIVEKKVEATPHH